jgi:signal transduction histidine kinase
VEQFEGDIWIDSKLGVGSTFFFKFKIYPKQDQVVQSEDNDTEQVS